MTIFNISCRKCRGKRRFHIGDAIAFSGDKSYYSLAGLADAAKIAGLRVQGANGKISAIVSKASTRSSVTLKKAKKNGVLILGPEEFRIELKKICEGNLPEKRNPRFSSLISQDSKVFAWGLDDSQESILKEFCCMHGIKRWKVRKSSLIFSITTSIHTNSGNAKILQSMGVPVYDFNKIKKTLKG